MPSVGRKGVESSALRTYIELAATSISRGCRWWMPCPWEGMGGSFLFSPHALSFLSQMPSFVSMPFSWKK